MLKKLLRLLIVMLQGGVLPPDSKYYPKNLGPRMPLPTIPLDSLKAREIWDSYVTPEDLPLQEETEVDAEVDKNSASAALSESEIIISPLSSSPSGRISPTLLPSRSKT